MGWFKTKKKEDRHRQILAAAKRQTENRGKHLKITPPEGVPLDLPLASLGSRFGAQFVDFLVTISAATLLFFLIIFAFKDVSWFAWILFSLMFFLIRVPYYVLSELAWNGRTLAKRWFRIRVVSVNGRSLTPHQIVARNIMKEVEFFAPLIYILFGHEIHWSLTLIAFVWLTILTITMWRSKNNQRMGDIIANTAVIDNLQPMLLPEIASAAQSTARFVFTTEQLDHYGRFELQTLEQVLRAPRNFNNDAAYKQAQYETDIVQRIARKIKYTETITHTDRHEFLKDFYTAQRAHLENRKLFGDARDDKFFKDEKQPQ